VRDKRPDVPTSTAPRRPIEGPAAVLLLGNYRPTIALVRTLKPLGYRVIVGLGGGEGGAQYSRFVDEVWDHPPLAAGADRFVAALAAVLRRRPDIRVVVPVAEEFVRVVSDARDALPADRSYAVPSRAVIDATLDKAALWRLATSAGVPVAPYAVTRTHAELRDACTTIGWPIVLRPFESTRRLYGRKAIVVASAEELTTTCPAWPTEQTAILVQRWVCGARHNIYFAARAGRIVRIVEAVIDRTDEPDATGLAVEGRTVPASDDLFVFTARLTGALDYTGVGCAQFLVDRAAGAVHLLEINARIAGNHAVAEAAGLELGPLAIRLAAADPPDVPFVAGKPGLVYAWTYGDVRGLVVARREGRISRFEAVRWCGRLVRTVARAGVHMTWRWDDPMPTVVLYGRHVPGLSRLVGRRVRPPLWLPTALSAAD